MLTISATQLDAWIAMYMFPLARILALLATAPAFSNQALPVSARLIVGLGISMALSPALPPMPVVPAGSWVAFTIIIQELMIGTLLGFSMRIVFAAIDTAGELIGMQMGLSFAVSYDPQTAGQTPAITEFLALLTTLTFLASNGHLLILQLLAESFTILPVSALPFSAASLQTILAWGGSLFSFGLLLAMPLVAALLITNIGLGILARVAPQLNLFSIGFAVTIVAGFFILTLSLPYIGAALERLFEQSFLAMGQVMKAAQIVPL